MCNPGIRSRHWKAMSDIIGFDITPDSGSTLRKVLKFNLKPYMDEFESISAGASKVSHYLLRLKAAPVLHAGQNQQVTGSGFLIELFSVPFFQTVASILFHCHPC